MKFRDWISDWASDLSYFVGPMLLFLVLLFAMLMASNASNKASDEKALSGCEDPQFHATSTSTSVVNGTGVTDRRYLYRCANGDVIELSRLLVGGK